MKSRIIWAIVLLVLIAITYLTLYPVPIEPGAWTPPADPGLTGKYAPNEKLREVQKKGDCPKCEDIAIDDQGNVFASADDGRIIVFNADFSKQRTLANTGGRPLGMAIDALNNIFVADAHKGILMITPKGKVKVLTDSYQGRKMLFLDDIAQAPDSSIIFSEASSKFPLEHDVLDIIEHQPNGNLFRYDLKTGITELLMAGMYFANGIAISPDSTYLLVNNMTKYQVLKYFLTGDRKGQHEVFVENLPGYPDGVNFGLDGTVWVSIPTLRVKILDDVLPYPFLRKMIMRLPQSKDTPAYGCMFGFDQSGNLTHNFQGPADTFTGITNIVAHGNALYLGSIRESSLGVLQLK